MIKKFICAVLVLCMICPTGAFAARGEQKQSIIYQKTFDDEATNSVPEGVTINGGAARIIETGENNKLLKFFEGAKTSAKFPYSTDLDEYTIDFVLSADAAADMNISLCIGNFETNILYVRGGILTTVEGKKLGGISISGFSRVSVAIEKKSGRFGVYAGGKSVLSRWKLPTNGKFDAIKFIRNEAMTENVYIDNICVHSGTKPLERALKSAYSDDGEEFLNYNDDLGDFSFFKSDYITHRYVAYPNTTLNAKTNEIVCEKFDYTNPDKGDKIIFKKTTSDDAFIDITAKIFSTYLSDKVYKNFKLSGKFMCDFEGGGTAYIYQLRDTSSSTQVNLYPIAVNEDGSIKLIDGTVVRGAAAKGKWFDITMYLNLNDHRITIFLDGKKVVDNAAISADMKNLNLVRVQARPGQFTGEMQCRKMEFTGLDKPYDGEEIMTSMFSDDEVLSDYLRDKVAFSYYSRNYCAHGVKADLTAEPKYADGELYVCADDFNSAFGVNLATNGDSATLGGKTIPLADGLVPVMKAAREILGKYTFDDTNGLIITSDEKIYFDASKETPYHKRKINSGYIDRLSDLQYLYDYLLFDRPKKDYLLSKFNEATDGGRMHPRVLATKSDFDRIKEQAKTDEFAAKMVDEVINQANDYIKFDPISYVYDDALRTSNTGLRLRDRMVMVGLAYQLTGDEKYAEFAWKNMDALNHFPDINPGHPIDTGMYGIGIAIAYDWCYDYYTEEQRRNICENAKRLHLTVISEGFYGRSPVRGGPDGNINVIGLYNKWISNYNIWVNTGSALMSLAFMDTYPEMCSDLLQNSIRSVEYTFKNLYPDGAWVESSNYWQIVALHMAYLFRSLNTVYGTDFNLSSFPGTEQTGLTHMALRSQIGMYNYHDANFEASLASDAMPFLGQYFGQPSLQAARKAMLTNEPAFSRTTKVKAKVFDLLCYDPSITTDELKNLPKVQTARGLEMFAVHEDYTDYDGLYLASHGGPVTFYHSHNDCGDFIFELDGVRWAMSLGSEDYNSSLPASEKYRMRTEGHNTVTINNGASLNQKGHTYAPLVRSDEGEGGAYAVYDMSDLYNDATSYRRGFYVGDNFRSLTVRDEIEVDKNSEIYWFMHTEQNVQKIDDKTVVLSSGGKSVTLTFDTDAADSELSIMDAKPLPTSPEGKGQNANSGVRKVAVRLSGSGRINLSVRIAEFGGSPSMQSIDSWTAPQKTQVTENNENYGFTISMQGIADRELSYVPVIDSSVLPQFSVKASGEGMTAELIRSDSLETANLVKVYNTDKSRYKLFVLPYNNTTVGIKEIVYDEVPIADYSVSSEPESANIGANMFDGDFSTRWTTLNTGETAMFDLGATKDIDGIAAGFWKSDTRRYSFDILTSADGTNWATAGSFQSELSPEDYQVFKFRANCRYIKFVGKGNTANVNSNVLEFRAVRMKEEFR